MVVARYWSGFFADSSLIHCRFIVDSSSAVNINPHGCVLWKGGVATSRTSPVPTATRSGDAKTALQDLDRFSRKRVPEGQTKTNSAVRRERGAGMQQHRFPKMKTFCPMARGCGSLCSVREKELPLGWSVRSFQRGWDHGQGRVLSLQRESRRHIPSQVPPRAMTSY
jgi:hypothetical protein